jgi:hypothetical protein
VEGTIPTIPFTQIADIVDRDVEPAVMGKRLCDRSKSVFFLRGVCDDQAGIGRQILSRIPSGRKVNRRTGGVKRSDGFGADTRAPPVMRTTRPSMPNPDIPPSRLLFR